MACFIFLLKTRATPKCGKIGITPFGSVKLKLWFLQKQLRICKTVDKGERVRGWRVGPADRWVPRDRETGSRDELGRRRSHRRRGLQGNRGHIRVPHIKANLLTYLAHALLDSRVLAVENGGAAALHSDTPVNLGHGDPVQVTDE